MTKKLERELSRAARGSYEEESARAAARLTETAAEAGVLDVAYGLVDSPLGPLVAAVTPRGLVTLAYERGQLEGILERIASRLSPRILEAPARLDRVRRELDEYFAGRRRDFELDIDWRLTRGFTQKVLRTTARIDFGKVLTYREVADRAGSPRAVRAAGNALGANPMPIVVPCHRVVPTAGGVGNYTGGAERKQFLLRLEGFEA